MLQCVQNISSTNGRHSLLTTLDTPLTVGDVTSHPMFTSHYRASAILMLQRISCINSKSRI